MLAAAALVAAIAWTSHASLAQLPGTSRTDLLRHDLSAPGREVIQVLVELAPVAAAPRHSHPGEELVYVVEGVLEYQLDGKPTVQLKAGAIPCIRSGRAHAAKKDDSSQAAGLDHYIVEKSGQASRRERGR